MIKFKFSVISVGNDLSGTELGDIDITLEDYYISSKGKSPNQSMMIFISLTDLLDGVRKLISNSRNREFKFIGAGSSFIVCFSIKEDTIALHYTKEKFYLNKYEFIKSLYQAANNFYKDSHSKFNFNNPIIMDLNDSLKDFRAII